MAVSLAVLALLWLVPLPPQPLIDLCGFHWLTGKLCPLCGLTRALFALGKGHWAQAIAFNALSPLGFAMLFSVPWTGAWRAWLWKGGLAAFAVYGIYRLV